MPQLVTSRRSTLGAMIAAAIGAVAGRAGAQGEAGAAADPRTDFQRPPFPKQRQDWPGLASMMEPRPDHGEQSYRGSRKLAGRRALLTGGDSGIGRAAAIAFAREGADVAINYLPQEEPDARQVIELVGAAGRKAIPLPGDIRDEGFCRKLVSDAAGQLGGLDILVNNAARQFPNASLLDISDEALDATFKTNVYAMFWITQAALPHLGPGAAIINTSSVNAYDPSEVLLDYAATKAAVAVFTKAIAKQLAPRGIRVNAVAPGPIWTPLQVASGQEPDSVTMTGAATPLGRPGQPVELAPIYVALAAGDAGYSSGEIVSVTGGSGLV